MPGLIRIKACKKCGGDLFLENDTYGTYYVCIQCGATCSNTSHADKLKVHKAESKQAVIASVR